jgi:hypothetical protein
MPVDGDVVVVVVVVVAIFVVVAVAVVVVVVVVVDNRSWRGGWRTCLFLVDVTVVTVDGIHGGYQPDVLHTSMILVGVGGVIVIVIVGVGVVVVLVLIFSISCGYDCIITPAVVDNAGGIVIVNVPHDIKLRNKRMMMRAATGQG